MSDANHLSLSQVGQISIVVHDVAKAVDFYQNTLGMKLLYEMDKMAFFDCSGVKILLSIPEKPEFDHPSSPIYYKVTDINASYEALRARGVVFNQTPHKIADMGAHELWMAFFKDVDENILALMSETPKS